MPAEVVVAHFDSLVQVIRKASESQETRSANLKTTKVYFSELMRRYPELHDMLRINSRGKVTNEIARDGKEGRRYRSIAGQSWWRDISRDLAPYFGSVRTRQGEYLLFWAIPMMDEQDDKLVGALAVKLDLDECLDGAAKRLGAPLMVTYDGESIYRHQWRNIEDAKSSSFDIKGMEGLAVHYDASTVMSEARESSQAKESAKPAAASESMAATQEAPKAGRRNGIVLILLPILAVIAVGLIVFLYYQINLLLRQRHERLMRQIEARDEEETYRRRPTARFPYPKGAGSSGANASDDGMMAFDGDVTQRIPMPQSSAGTPSGFAQARTPPASPAATVPPAAASPAVSPGGMPPNTPPPPAPDLPPTGPAAPAPSAALSAEDYDRVRQQVLREIMPELRQRMVKELETRRAEMAKNADAFGSEVTMLLHELIGKISEMGDNATGIQTAVAATVRELNTVVGRYRSQQPRQPG